MDAITPKKWKERLAAIRELASLRGGTKVGRKPHVAVVGHSADKYLAGSERSLIDILAAIDRKKYTVSCVLPADNASYSRAVNRFADNVFIFSFGWWNGSKLFDESSVSKFEELITVENIDIVHVNTVTLIDPLVAARRLGLISISHVRELIDQDSSLAKMLTVAPADLVGKIKDASDYIIANSDATHTLYGKPGRSFRLYNCVDTDRFDVPNALSSDILKVGILSSNIPKKGIGHFVDTAVLAARRKLALEFVVFGPCNTHVEALERVARAEQVPVNLHFAGYVEDPLEAVRQVNVIASFSTVPESFGRTLAEGMAARRPIVAFEGGAVREIVRHGVDGFVVPRYDVEQALCCLDMLSRDPDLVSRMGQAGRKRATKLFARPRFATQLNKIYRRALKNRKALAR